MNNKKTVLLRFLIRATVDILILALFVFLACIPILSGCTEAWLNSAIMFASIFSINILLLTVKLDLKIADRILPRQESAAEHDNNTPEIIGLTSPIGDAYYEYWPIFTSPRYSIKRVPPKLRALRMFVGLTAAIFGAAVLIDFVFSDEMEPNALLLSFLLLFGGIGIVSLGYIRGVLSGLCGMALAAVIVMCGDRIEALADTSIFTAIILLVSVLFVFAFLTFLLVRHINRTKFKLPAYDHGSDISVPIRLIKPDKPVVCAVTVKVDSSLPGAEKRYIINKASDIASFCRQKEMTYVGLRATKYDPTVTYISYCSDEKAAEKLKAHIASLIDGEITETLIKSDENYEVYKSLLPDEKALFRAFNALFAPGLEAQPEAQFKLSFAIYFDGDQSKADELLAADCSLKFECGDGENIAEATTAGHFNISDINALTDELVTLAERFDARLLPWVIAPLEE